MHQSLDQRFSDMGRQLPMTASCHLWSMVKAQDNGTDRPSLDQRFSSVEGMSPTSMLHRRVSFSRPMDCGKDRQSPVAGGQGLSTATAATGQGQAASPVAGLQGGDTHQALSSHSARTSNVTRWTVEQPQHLSIWRPTTDHGQDRQVNRGYKNSRTGHSKCRSTRHRL